jgi:CHAD domain-containing protein
MTVSRIGWIMPSHCTQFDITARRAIASIGRDRVLDAATAEGIHDLRVACRRARVALAELKPALRDKPRRAARRDLRDIGRRLSNLRELDVSIGLLFDGIGEGFDGTPALEFARRKLHEARAAEEMRLRARPIAPDAFAQRISRVLDRDMKGSDDCLVRHAPKRLSRRLDELQARYERWRETELAEDLHRLRVGFKTMRYTMEVYAPLYGKPGKEFLHTLESAQESIGQWNDRRILRERLSGVARSADSALRPALGELTAAVAQQAEALQARVENETKEFFRKRSLRGFGKLFDHPAAPCCHGAR